MEPKDDVITVSAEKYQQLVDAVANAVQDKTNLVDEIKDIREKKRLAEEALEAERAAKAPLDTEHKNFDPAEIQRIAQEELKSERQKELAKMREKTLESFKKSKPALNPENEGADVIAEKFASILARFNVNDITEEEEYKSLLNDAYKLMTDRITSEGNPPPDSPPEPKDSPSLPPNDTRPQVSAIEQKIIDRTFGGDVQRYLKIREKRPEYVQELLKWAE